MKRLSDKECQRILDEMRNAADGGAFTWNAWYDVNARPAILEFPGGELANECWNNDLAGFIWGWKLKDCIQPLPLEKSDRFSAQGLEGKIRIETDTVAALICWEALPRYRRQVRQ